MIIHNADCLFCFGYHFIINGMLQQSCKFNTVLTNFILNHDGGIFVCYKFKDIFLMKISEFWQNFIYFWV